jgi:hypothetical protein
MSAPSWQDTCGICGGQRWWPSKVHDLKVCYECSGGDPLAALVILARRAGATSIAQAQAWATAVADSAVPSSTCLMEANVLRG